jgi:ankyrin repeat protein
MRGIDNQLINACVEGGLQEVKELLDNGANINAKDEYGNTALILAAHKGHTEIVKLLMDSGADVNAKNIFSNTPLMVASWRGHPEVVKLFLGKGADMEAKNIFGNTPLIFTLRHGHLDIVELLVSKGADIEARDNQGRTAISYAFDIEDKDKRRELLEIFNHYHPEAFMSEYLDWNTGAGEMKITLKRKMLPDSAVNPLPSVMGNAKCFSLLKKHQSNNVIAINISM